MQVVQMKKLVWVLALFGLMFAAANGAGAGSDVRQSILEMRYAQLECRAGFLYSAMDSAEEAGGDLSEDRAALEAVMAKLRSYADAGDVYGYNHYMAQAQNSFSVAVRSIQSARLGALDAAGSCSEGAGGQGGQGSHGAGPANQSGGCQTRAQLREQLRTQYDEARSEYAECMHAAVRGRVQAEISEFEGWASNGRRIAENMASRNYSVSGLNAIIEEAEEEADELEAAAESEEDADALLEIRKEKWGHIFYLWAQFHRERIGLLLDRFEEKTDGYEAEAAGIRALLDEAASVGDDEIYTLEEAQESRALIGQATEEFSALVKEARGK